MILNEEQSKIINSKYKEYSYLEIETDSNIFNEICSIKVDFYETIKLNLKNNKYLIVRNFGTKLSALVGLVNFLSGGKFFYIPNLKKAFVAKFKMRPTDELSHTLDDGYFHTDYSLHPKTNDFITLQIVKADPKYPFYSRNSIILVEQLIDFLNKYDQNLLNILSTVKFPFDNGKRVVYQEILDIENKTIKYHSKLIQDRLLSDKKYSKYLESIKKFDVICNSLSIDFALDKGDLAILSNKKLLHKRGVASVKYDENLDSFVGREVNSIRFYTNDL